MRPVNLIPPDERRGDEAPLRTGHLVYVLTAGLALLLLGIVAVTLTGKQISDREDQKASLQQELDQATRTGQQPRRLHHFPRGPGVPACDGHQPRPEPLRLVTRPARALPGAPERRLAQLAHRKREPRRSDVRRQRQRRRVAATCGATSRARRSRSRAAPRVRTRWPASWPPWRTSTASPASGSESSNIDSASGSGSGRPEQHGLNGLSGRPADRQLRDRRRLRRGADSFHRDDRALCPTVRCSAHWDRSVTGRRRAEGAGRCEGFGQGADQQGPECEADHPGRGRLT